MTYRQFLPREVISWCISETSFQAYEQEGLILTKAHRTRVVADSYGILSHKPKCGAALLHLATDCVVGPERWPQCRKCALKESPIGVPTVFEEAVTP